MFFKEFLHAYRTEKLDERAAWRAYNVLQAVKAHHALKGLRALGYKYAGELSLPTFMAQYGVTDRMEAQTILGAWWLLRELEAGGRPKGLSLMSVAD